MCTLSFWNSCTSCIGLILFDYIEVLRTIFLDWSWNNIHFKLMKEFLITSIKIQTSINFNRLINYWVRFLLICEFEWVYFLSKIFVIIIRLKIWTFQKVILSLPFRKVIIISIYIKKYFIYLLISSNNPNIIN